MLASQFGPTMRAFISFYAGIPSATYRKTWVFAMERRGRVLRRLTPRESRSISVEKGGTFAGRRVGGGDSLRQKQHYVIAVQSIFQSMFSLPPD